MISRPHVGQSVQLWYAAKKRSVSPHHAAFGAVEIVSRGPGPRNVGVRVDGRLIVVPCGNLRQGKRGGE